MDGAYALLFLVAGLTDMKLNHCSEGCLARRDAQAHASLSYGDVIFQTRTIGREAYFRYDLGQMRGPFQPAIGVSITDTGDAWVGFGATHTTKFATPFFGGGSAYVQLSLLPGLYARGSGPDLGHVIEFRSGAEIGYLARNGIKYGISYDHRSNSELSSLNPGLETLSFRVTFPVK